MIFTYNKEHVGDVLMVIVKTVEMPNWMLERKGKVARVFLKEMGKLWLGIFSKFLAYLKLLSAVKSFFDRRASRSFEPRIAGGRFYRRNRQ